MQYCDYASPIVSVLKHDGSVRICADYKQTLNTFASIDSYPIPVKKVDLLVLSCARMRRCALVGVAFFCVVYCWSCSV